MKPETLFTILCVLHFGAVAYAIVALLTPLQGAAAAATAAAGWFVGMLYVANTRDLNFEKDEDQ